MSEKRSIVSGKFEWRVLKNEDLELEFSASRHITRMIDFELAWNLPKYMERFEEKLALARKEKMKILEVCFSRNWKDFPFFHACFMRDQGLIVENKTWEGVRNVLALFLGAVKILEVLSAEDLLRNKELAELYRRIANAYAMVNNTEQRLLYLLKSGEMFDNLGVLYYRNELLDERSVVSELVLEGEASMDHYSCAKYRMGFYKKLSGMKLIMKECSDVVMIEKVQLYIILSKKAFEFGRIELSLKQSLKSLQILDKTKKEFINSKDSSISKRYRKSFVFTHLDKYLDVYNSLVIQYYANGQVELGNSYKRKVLAFGKRKEFRNYKYVEVALRKMKMFTPRSVLKILPEKKSFCKRCGKESKHYCGNCRVFSYCSKECQKLDWRAHKVYCIRVNVKDI